MNKCLLLFYMMILINPLAAQENFAFSFENREFFEEELAFESTPILPPHQPVEIQVTTKCLNQGAMRVVLNFPDHLKVLSKKEECNRLFVAFNQQINGKDLLKISENLGYLIKRFINGVNSIYFIPKRPLLYRTFQNGKQFVVDLIPDYRKPTKATRALQISKARLLIENRCYVPAFHALHALKCVYPNNKEILVLLAGLEGILPRWQRQIHIYGHLRTKYPCDENIKRLSKWAFFPHSPYVRFGRDLLRTVGLAAQQMYRVEAEQILDANYDRYLYIGENYKAETGHLASVVNSTTGLSEGFAGTRHLGKVYLRNETKDGVQTTGTLYGSQGGTLGVGGKVTWLWPLIQGDITVAADYHRPYWETFESFANQGREDILRADLNGVYNRYISWSLGGGVDRVGISGVPNGFSAALGNAQVFWNLVIPNPIFALNYSYDAIYVYQRATLIGIDGQPFNPVPLSSFEFHSIRAYVFYEWRERYHFGAYFGETMNRFGTHSTTYGVNARYAKPCPNGIEWSIAYSKYPSTIIPGATADYLTGSLTIRY